MQAILHANSAPGAEQLALFETFETAAFDRTIAKAKDKESHYGQLAGEDAWLARLSRTAIFNFQVAIYS